MIVSEPPPCCGATERAEPKNALGFAIAVASRPPLSVRPVPRSAVLCARARRVIESSTITTSLPTLDQPARALQRHVRHVHVTLGRLIEARRDHFAASPRDHLAHFFRTLVDEQHEQRRARDG